MRTLTRQKLQSFRPLRGRRNPTTILAPAGVAPRSWQDQLVREREDLRKGMFMLRQQLVEKGVAEDMLPTLLDIKKYADESALLLASAQYADLAGQSKLLTPTANVAEEILGLSSGGVFEKAASAPDAKPIVTTAKNALIAKLDTRRKIALAKRASAEKDIRAAEMAAKEAELERLEAEAERRRLEEQGEEAEVEERISRDDVEALAAALKADEEAGEEDEEEDEEEAAEEAPKKRRSSGRARTRRAAAPVTEREEEEEEAPRFEGTLSQRGERLAGYANYLARVRERVPLDSKLAEATKGDSLLNLLNNGTTQVWIKGALTESITASRGRASWMAAKGYALEWLKRPGTLGGVKKSHMGVRVVFSTQEEPDRVKVVQPSFNDLNVEKAKKVPSYDTVFEQLVGKKANPRERAFRNPESEAIAQQLRASFRLSNPRKLAVPEHIAKTPRKMGERISAIGVKGKWPIGDLFHARLAAVYIMSPSHHAKKAQVLRALELHYPQYDWQGFISRSGALRQVGG